MANTEYTFTVYAQPVPASRPRVTRKGVYYGERYEAWRSIVQVAALKHGRPMCEGPVRLFIDIYGARANADWDNLGKGISDALEGIMYANDRQVRYARVELHDCSPKQRRAEITVSPIEESE